MYQGRLAALNYPHHQRDVGSPTVKKGRKKGCLQNRHEGGGTFQAFLSRRRVKVSSAPSIREEPGLGRLRRPIGQVDSWLLQLSLIQHHYTFRTSKSGNQWSFSVSKTVTHTNILYWNNKCLIGGK